jgi:glycosyltransferase involved in cell wall biosynthesis
VDHFPLIERGSRAAARAALSIPADARVVAYLGSIGGWYLLGEMVDFFRAYSRRFPDAVFLFVTPGDPAVIVAEAAKAGIASERVVIRSASRDEVPRLMAAADFGLFFVKPCFAATACSPTKMAEMLALGLPIVTNAGVGDIAEIIRDTGCGVAIERFDEKAYEAAIIGMELLGLSAQQLSETARSQFDLKIAINCYETAYRALAPTTDVSTSTKRGA